METIPSAQIDEPKVKVSPPSWALMIFLAISIGVFIALSQLPMANAIVKYSLLAIYGLAMLGILRKQLTGNYLATLQANAHGLYFQTDNTNEYVHVPWTNVGSIEKTLFPLNTRGLRIEITGDLIEPVRHSKDLGNVRSENGRTYIYTIPQLHRRDSLIEQFESLRKGIAQ